MPLGRNWQIRPLAFSLEPRRHGVCGSQKKVSNVCLARSDSSLRRALASLSASLYSEKYSRLSPDLATSAFSEAWRSSANLSKSAALMAYLRELRSVI